VGVEGLWLGILLTRKDLQLLRFIGSIEYGKCRVSIPGGGARDCKLKIEETDVRNVSSCFQLVLRLLLLVFMLKMNQTTI
jgi:hypothetical protein